MGKLVNVCEEGDFEPQIENDDDFPETNQRSSFPAQDRQTIFCPPHSQTTGSSYFVPYANEASHVGEKRARHDDSGVLVVDNAVNTLCDLGNATKRRKNDFSLGKNKEQTEDLGAAIKSEPDNTDKQPWMLESDPIKLWPPRKSDLL